MTDREAAAGLVESMPGVCDALDRMGMHILAGFCEDIGPTITTLLSELERVGKELSEFRELYAREARKNIVIAESQSAAEARALKAEKERDEWKAEAVRVCEPFAKRAGKLDGHWLDHETNWSPAYGSTEITIGALRAARAFIEKAKS